MFLQAFVQLNILIAAAPALAGWILLPVQTLPLHVAAVMRVAAIESAKPVAQKAQTETQSDSVPIAVSKPLLSMPAALAVGTVLLPETIDLALPNPLALPHAPRAP